MARLKRSCPAGIPVHIIQRGNNRQACFAAKNDFVAYAGLLKNYSKKFDVSIHAWVLMTNHVHLLATPMSDKSIPLMMQGIGRQYVRYFNDTYSRTGTLWEGRYKSCLVDSEAYLLQVHRYIELNPVRAGIVSDPGDYYWSSYKSNALGVRSNLITIHPIYERLGMNDSARTEAYRTLVKEYLDGESVEEIRASVQKGLALGSGRFKEEMERLHRRRLTARKAGRPRQKGK